MSWLFSRALVAEYLAANCLDGKQSAPSKSTPTAQAYLWPDKTMESWSRFPSGMTCEHSTGDGGAELLTWFLEASRVKTSVLPVWEGGLMESEADFGGKCRESLAKYDRASHSWKIHQLSLLEDSEEYSVIWKRWGTMHDGEYFPLVPLVRHIHERGCFFWSTPTASDYRGPNKAVKRKQNGRWILDKPSGIYGAKLIDAIGGTMNPLWEEWLIGWPIGWTELRSLETDKYQVWLQTHLEFY